MANVYDFSFEEFEKYFDSIRNKSSQTKSHISINENKAPKEFSSIEELDKYYNSSDAIEFFKNEMLE